MSAEPEVRLPWLLGFGRTWSVAVLSAAFSVAYAVAAAVFARRACRRHRFRAFQGYVLVLAMVWAAARAVYFGIQILAARPAHYPYWFEEVLCWVPVNVQVATYSVVAVFCALTAAAASRAASPWLVRALWALNAVLGVLTVAWLVAAGDAPAAPMAVVDLRYALSMLTDVAMFAALATCLVRLLQGERVRAKRGLVPGYASAERSNDDARGSILHSAGNITVVELKLVSFTALLAFAVRTGTAIALLVCLLAPTLPNVPDVSPEAAELLTFFFYAVTELLPLTMLLIGIRRVTATPAGAAAAYQPLGHGAVPDYSTFSTARAASGAPRDADDDEDALFAAATAAAAAAAPSAISINGSSGGGAVSPPATSARSVPSAGRSSWTSGRTTSGGARSYSSMMSRSIRSGGGLGIPTGSNSDIASMQLMFTGSSVDATQSPSSWDAIEWESRRPSMDEKSLAATLVNSNPAQVGKPL